MLGKIQRTLHLEDKSPPRASATCLKTPAVQPSCKRSMKRHLHLLQQISCRMHQPVSSSLAAGRTCKSPCTRSHAAPKATFSPGWGDFLQRVLLQIPFSSRDGCIPNITIPGDTPNIIGRGCKPRSRIRDCGRQSKAKVIQGESLPIPDALGN